MRIVPLVSFAAEAQSSDFLIGCLQNGTVLHDHNGVFQKLRAIADPVKIWMRRRERIPSAVQAWIKSQAAGLKRDIKSLYDSENADIEAMIDAAVFETVGILFALAGQDIPKISRRLEKASLHFAETRPVLDEFKAARSIDEKMRVFALLCDTVVNFGVVVPDEPIGSRQAVF